MKDGEKIPREDSLMLRRSSPLNETTGLWLQKHINAQNTQRESEAPRRRHFGSWPFVMRLKPTSRRISCSFHQFLLLLFSVFELYLIMAEVPGELPCLANSNMKLKVLLTVSQFTAAVYSGTSLNTMIHIQLTGTENLNSIYKGTGGAEYCGSWVC
ncbi:hypothetical protein GOODEAATRI_032718 [Goodea atripinnis]|uniref:Uncharacterized protein n=1 Tax=Goodea atripinnis TaxID=208336 RepID=A0ABV0NFJ1_9TELE